MTRACTSVEDLITSASTVFSVLPDKLDKQNVTLFSDICEYVDSLCSNPDLHRLLMPFHHLTFGWQSAYGEGFTWLKFLQDILESNCTEVLCISSSDDTVPSLWFSKNLSTKEYDFSIVLVHDD